MISKVIWTVFPGFACLHVCGLESETFALHFLHTRLFEFHQTISEMRCSFFERDELSHENFFVTDNGIKNLKG
jgi:hypothetical protein